MINSVQILSPVDTFKIYFVELKLEKLINIKH